ncbi:uncharacterized protein Z520_01159 [Fonsecaea multimorphosa CBS 102226]|uniref:Signal recognition particle subunit SRP14 n=1 Tax=Fonsecaea multimorphosa CBS 102226 TaxID=1442371 RepID=A0A0D2L0Y2_9EURO|nr:uncharacterized protein Z520_01159 [Fonsecaea multimorphosa CBS 102226]KIY02694.1 hypothetical protein Z520_01159 [Fonsecaea multimorphosa CBS 102226]OAL31556.1 hypothetical protein AYO22_01148 [Fonsecaea multimorphosa]
MSQERLSNDEFLTRLSTLLTSTHAATHGSVYLTQKPLTPTADESTTLSSQVLIRASNGLSKPHRTASKKVAKSGDAKKEKVKFATVVEVAELEAFYTKYAETCKKGMEGLRKRDKKKAKEKAKAKKKGKGGAGGGGEKASGS